MDNDTSCSLPNCGKPLKRAGYCYGHYMKNWRYGTPTPDFGWTRGEKPIAPPRTSRADLTGRRFGALVVVTRQLGGWECRCDCGVIVMRKAGGLNRGDIKSCGNTRLHRRRDDIGYGMAHDRVRSDRGPVQSHECVGCGAPAQHWSYDHTDPDELLAHGLSVHPVAYSVRPEHYSPRCIPCHKRFDLDRIDAASIG